MQPLFLSLLLILIQSVLMISINKNYLTEAGQSKEEHIDPSTILVAFMKSKEMNDTTHYVKSDESLQEIQKEEPSFIKYNLLSLKALFQDIPFIDYSKQEEQQKQFNRYMVDQSLRQNQQLEDERKFRS